MKKLKGWKTIIGLVAGALVLAAGKMGWLPAEQVEWLLLPIGTWTGVSLRLGIKTAKRSGYVP